MNYRYMLYEEYLKKDEEKILKGEPVEMEIRDEDTKSWIKVRAIVGQNVEGGEAAAVLAPFGAVYDEGKWFVRVLEEISDESNGD